MNSKLSQWKFLIEGLVPEQVKLRKKVWLKKGEILLDKKGDELFAYVLDDSNGFRSKKKITPYLWVSCLISNNNPGLTSKGGQSMSSRDELGTMKHFSFSIKSIIPDEVVSQIENYAPKFLGFIGDLHDKYIKIINENEFLSIALNYFYEAQNKYVHSDIGFINSMISLEALFNESPTDIKYKLSHRAGFMLGLCDIDSVKTFETLNIYYKYRSIIVHGGGALPHDSDTHLVTHYTRKAIIMFLILLNNKERQQIGKQKRKIELLKEIDYAMLDENKRKALKQEIKKGLKDFKLKIPRVFEGVFKNEKYRTTAW